MKKWFWIILFFLETTSVHAQPNVIDTSIIPASELNGKVWAVASQSVINVYVDPTYRAEMTTQVLLGTPLKVLAKKRGWYQIVTPEGYEGWISSSLRRMDSVTLHQMNMRPRIIVTANNSFVYEGKNKKQIVAEVVMGNIVYADSPKKQKGLYKVSLPDGRKGYIKVAAVKKWEDWRSSIRLTGESILQVAAKYIGLPYFWGGVSTRGVDCSGLTKATYFMHGIILPRDARQQYLTGANVDTTNQLAFLQKGDLLFFGYKNEEEPSGYRIIHTGIYLQNKQFIQAGDGCVQMSSLNPADNNYDAHNGKRFVAARRIIHGSGNGTWRVFDHPWYQ
ncbi:MAG: NlpC/P60 family protein [Niabella sp.]